MANECNCTTRSRIAPLQFDLRSLLELVTLLAILFALAKVTGVAGSILLALMAVCLMAKRGLPAILALAAALIAADASFGAGSYGPTCLILIIGAALCGWFRMREWTAASCQKWLPFL